MDLEQRVELRGHAAAELDEQVIPVRAGLDDGEDHELFGTLAFGLDGDRRRLSDRIRSS